VLAKAARDILTRRQLCQALFYEAVKKLEAGDEEGYHSGMRACSGLRNPILEREWYLACHESDARGTKKH
jgi:hypothetical protein